VLAVLAQAEVVLAVLAVLAQAEVVLAVLAVLAQAEVVLAVLAQAEVVLAVLAQAEVVLAVQAQAEAVQAVAVQAQAQAVPAEAVRAVSAQTSKFPWSSREYQTSPQTQIYKRLLSKCSWTPAEPAPPVVSRSIFLLWRAALGLPEASALMMIQRCKRLKIHSLFQRSRTA
jgi:hypothetical protein